MTKIKICGLFRDCDIDYVNEAGPDYVGFIIDYPKSHRSVSPERAGGLRRNLREGIAAVGVFVDKEIGEVCAAAKTAGLDIIQLHGHEDEAYIASLRKQCKLPIWKAFKVRSAEDLKTAEKSSANAVLLDNGYGTGETFDWSMMRDFRRPFILAGGLSPQNIPAAIKTLHPIAVDISSGVETDKKKDRTKILAVVETIYKHSK